MLGDFPPAWPAYPQACHLRALWQALRQSWLLALWADYQGARSEGRSAAAVVAATVEELQRLMRVQFRTAAMPPEVVDSLPFRLLNAQFKQDPLSAFQAVWAHRGVLCSVAEDEEGAVRLRVLLTSSHPVPVPPTPPA
jgi:hypothetical protein